MCLPSYQPVSICHPPITMESAASYHTGDSTAAYSITSLDAAGLPAISPPPRPQLYTGDHQNISYQINPTMPHSESDFRGRDMFTPSPTSSSASLYDRSSPPSLYTPDTSVAPSYSFQPAASDAGQSSVSFPGRQTRRLSEPACLDAAGFTVRGQIAHPYARLYNKKNSAGKRRKMWNHALEKVLFTPQEMYVHSHTH